MYDTELERQVLKTEVNKKVKKFFGEVPKEKKKLADDLLGRLGEVIYIIEMLQADIDKKGIYGVNGNGRTCSNPSIGSLNNLLKTYTSLFKQAVDFLGKENLNGNKDDLLAFLNNKE